MDLDQDQLGYFTANPIRENNAIQFLPSGGASYKIRWKLLKAAKHSIHIATFSMMNDGTTRKLETILMERLKAGVEVRIIFDDIVNRSTFAKPMINRLVKAGAQVHGYNGLFEEWWPLAKQKPLKHLIRNIKLKLKRHYHEKYMIVDGTDAILGGINWGDKYAYGGIKSFAWRDSDVYLRGVVVSDLQVQFLKDFSRYQAWSLHKADQPNFYPEFVKQNPVLTREEVIQRYPAHCPELGREGKVAIRYIAHKPYDDNELAMTHAFLSLIKNAKHSIYWGCHGVRPPRIYGEYLAEAVKRGVKVHLITNSKYSSQSLMARGLLGWMYKECTKYYRRLLDDGVHLYEWQLEGAFHSKNFLVDDQLASIGSYNLARGSSYHHSESNIFVYDQGFALEVKQQFEDDFKHCKEIKRGDVESQLPSEDAFERPLHERDLMIQADMIPESIQKELDKKTYTRILT
ncbi:MAG: phosphatidylserine/phosphatidylglycerophosphate/cardiolipin synthase family protein [Cocleimonas sp.]|nr:phosphatidylserine/phosphatidylglycerophosphate/cardiolipin synthase family protein [Cocleimonas sp.]